MIVGSQFVQQPFELPLRAERPASHWDRVDAAAFQRPDQDRRAVVAAQRAADLDGPALASLGEMPLSVCHVILPHDQAIVVGQIVQAPLGSAVSLEIAG